MDLTEGSETSANINQTLGKHPKVNTVNILTTASIKWAEAVIFPTGKLFGGGQV
jgi:hypothetical protein